MAAEIIDLAASSGQVRWEQTLIAMLDDTADYLETISAAPDVQAEAKIQAEAIRQVLTDPRAKR